MYICVCIYTNLFFFFSKRVELFCLPQVCIETPRADACRLYVYRVVRTLNEFQVSRTRLHP